MKKIILSVALLAGMTIVACSSDDDKGGSNCVTCKISLAGQSQSQEVCNKDGRATVSGVDAGMSFDDYVDTFEAAGGECN